MVANIIGIFFINMFINIFVLIFVNHTDKKYVWLINKKHTINTYKIEKDGMYFYVVKYIKSREFVFSKYPLLLFVLFSPILCYNKYTRNKHKVFIGELDVTNKFIKICTNLKQCYEDDYKHHLDIEKQKSLNLETIKNYNK